MIPQSGFGKGHGSGYLWSFLIFMVNLFGKLIYEYGFVMNSSLSVNDFSCCDFEVEFQHWWNTEFIMVCVHGEAWIPTVNIHTRWKSRQGKLQEQTCKDNSNKKAILEGTNKVWGLPIRDPLMVLQCWWKFKTVSDSSIPLHPFYPISFLPLVFLLLLILLPYFNTWIMESYDVKCDEGLCSSWLKFQLEASTIMDLSSSEGRMKNGEWKVKS